MPCEAPVMMATFCSIPMMGSCCWLSEPAPAAAGLVDEVRRSGPAANMRRPADTLSQRERMPDRLPAVVVAAGTNAYLGVGARWAGGKRMDRLDAMKVFVLAVDEGSLAAAG